VDADDLRLVLVTHSVPEAMADTAGPAGGAYVAQHEDVAATVAAEVSARVGRELPWTLVYCSRSGPPTQPWLEPDVNDHLRELAAAGAAGVVLAPIGFVSDHMEVLWDLDTEAMAAARDAGLRAVRIPTPGTDPGYVAGLADLVQERLSGAPAASRPHVTPLGPWFDVCRPGCCENVRAGFRPAVAGVAP
jgi:ferrochelatase